MNDYEQLLDRGLAGIKRSEKQERWEVLRAQTEIMGARTAITNFTEVAAGLRREAQHLQKFLVKELATSGEMQAGRLVVLGNFSAELVNKKIDLYVRTFVLCEECKKPDTKILKEGKVHILKCEACGARHPIAKV